MSDTENGNKKWDFRNVLPANVENPFKDSKGEWLTRGLFIENRFPGRQDCCMFTLKSQDHAHRNGNTYPSLYRLYMECEDLTEYEFATEHLGGWEHWKELQKCGWFKEYIDLWREELEVKMRSEALRNIANTARSGGKESYTANKLLLERGWVTPEQKTDEKKRKVGRPSKEKIVEAAFSTKEEQDKLEELKKLTLN